MSMQSSSRGNHQSGALARINRIYADIGLSRHPDVLVAAFVPPKALTGKKILLLDDSAWVFELYALPLMQATGGNAYFLLHQGLKLNSLVEKIIEIDPQYVLMDANLDAGLSGIDVTAELTRREKGIRVIGFSNSLSYASSFMEAGAVGAVRKRSDDVEKTMGELAEVIGSR